MMTDHDYHEILNFLPYPIIITNQDCLAVHVNKSWITKVGIGYDLSTGKGYLEAGFSQQDKDLLNILHQTFSSCLEISLKDMDQDYRWYRLESSNYNDLILTSFVDIHDSKVSELMLTKKIHSLESNLEIFQKVLHELPIGITIASASKGEIILHNDEIKKIWKHDICEAKGIEDYINWNAYHEDGTIFQPFDWPSARTLLTEEEVHDQKINCFFGDGTSGHILCSSKPIYDKHGQMVAAFVVSIDITEKFEMEEEKKSLISREKSAIEASQLKSQFLANMSHEIRTPLNAVIGIAELLVLDQSLSSKNHESLFAIYQSGKLLLNLVNDILDFSKVEAGQLKLEQVPFCIGSVFEYCRTIMEPLALKKKLDLKFNVETNLGWIKGDPLRLQQILINIVSNAIKFTAKGYVLVSANGTSIEGELFQLEVLIEDTGIGMSDETQSRLFQPFMQADSSTTRKYGGTGLGLCTCKKLMDLMGGQITVTSHLEKGSSFKICIPFEVTEHEFTETVKCDLKFTFDKGDIALLVVEDNEINSFLLKKILIKLGFSNIKIASNGSEAVSAVQEGRFDLILMDCQMPVMDGFEATKRIKRLPGGENVPIIAMSASFSALDKDRYVSSGMDYFLTKPTSIVDVDRVIQKFSFKKYDFSSPRYHAKENILLTQKSQPQYENQVLK